MQQPELFENLRQYRTPLIKSERDNAVAEITRKMRLKVKYFYSRFNFAAEMAQLVKRQVLLSNSNAKLAVCMPFLVSLRNSGIEQFSEIDISSIVPF